MGDHCAIVVTNCDPIRDNSPQQIDEKERQDFCAEAFKKEFKDKLNVNLPVFRTSKYMDASVELIDFKNFLGSKTTYYTCDFFKQLHLAFQSGGFEGALTHAVQWINKVLLG